MDSQERRVKGRTVADHKVFVALVALVALGREGPASPGPTQRVDILVARPGSRVRLALALQQAAAPSAMTLVALPAMRLEEAEEARPSPARRSARERRVATAGLAALKPVTIRQLRRLLAPDASILADYRR